MANLKINGKQYNGVEVIGAPSVGGGTSKFFDASEADARPSEIAAGKKAVVSDGLIEGEMESIGYISETISSRNEVVYIDEGFTNGGSVEISSDEKDKIVAENIKLGVDILGVTGSYSGGTATLGTKTITVNGEYDASSDGYDGYSSVDVQVPASTPTMQVKSNIDPTTSSQTIEPDEGYDGLSSVQINAMPSGTAGTPTATKGAVSNHSISVTPSVTNTAGYISSGTINGTAVSVTASELDSGAKSITSNGNSQDVVGYASVNVNVPNSYSAGDEGKVVSSGALVAQTAHADVTPTTSDQTIDTTTNNSLKVKGDANLVAGNIKKDVEIFGTTGSYEGGGGGISVDDIATNTAPSGAVTLGSSVTEIKDYAFACKPVTSVSGQNVTKINPHSFLDSQITSIDDTLYPNLGVTETFIVLLNLPTTCTSIELTGEKIALSSGSYALRNNTGLITAKFPNAAKNVGNSYKGMGSYCFGGCTNLLLADCGFVNSVGNNAFNGATKITTIILRNTSVVSLPNTGAFNNSPFKSGGTGGTIYIPKSLYDHLGDGTSSDYQHASNWSTVHGYGTITWAKIEGSIYELT